MRWVLLIWIAVLAVTCPFTKVEESFNMQAVHDLLHHGPDILKYDHLEFPGVVPRSFIGAMAVATVAWPLRLAAQAYCHAIQAVAALGTRLGAPSLWAELLEPPGPGLTEQLCARLATGLLLWLAFCAFQRGVQAQFGPMVADFTALLTCLQFHLPFYMSRLLPNTLALALCLVAYGAWLRGGRAGHVRALLLVGLGAVTLRCDLLVLLAPMGVQFVLAGKVPLARTLAQGVAACLLALLLTVAVDSLMWRPGGGGKGVAGAGVEDGVGGSFGAWSALLQPPTAWLWPEGTVLFFNTLQNRSHLWGTQRWHWYASSAVPRALHVALPLALAGLLGLRRPRPGVRCLALWPPPAAAGAGSASNAKADANPNTIAATNNSVGADVDAAAAGAVSVDKDTETAGILLGETLDCLPGPDPALWATVLPALIFLALYRCAHVHVHTPALTLPLTLTLTAHVHVCTL